MKKTSSLSLFFFHPWSCLRRRERPAIKGHSSSSRRHQAAAAESLSSLHLRRVGFRHKQVLPPAGTLPLLQAQPLIYFVI